MKILTDDHWEVIIEHQEWLKKRVEQLEVQNVALLDRLLIHQGQLPIDLGTVKVVQEENKRSEELMELLTAEEIGEEPKEP
jgi:hypothetical protein